MELDEITVKLSSSEALVLLAWVSRFNDVGDATFEHQAEERVLWDLEASLERVLIAPLRKDYETALRKAREDVSDPA